MGNTWLIPKTVEKPADGRCKSVKISETALKENAYDE